MEHTIHADHPHQHQPDCGHESYQHNDHLDYVHDGHHHRSHDGHWDECPVAAGAGAAPTDHALGT